MRCVWSGVDPGGLSDMELLERLKEVGRARDRINGVFTEVAGEFVKRNCKEATAWAMREYLRVSGFQARRDAALAGDLVEHGLSDTVAAMRAGEITAGHARVIATAAPKPHRKDEAELLEIARSYAVDTCGRHTLAYESLQQMADDAAAGKGEPATRSTAPSAANARRRYARVLTACGCCQGGSTTSPAGESTRSSTP